MVTMGVFPFQGKTQVVEPGIEPGTSWLVVRSSDHQARRLVAFSKRRNKHTTLQDVTATCHVHAIAARCQRQCGHLTNSPGAASEA